MVRKGQRSGPLTTLKLSLQMPPDGFRQKQIIGSRNFNIGTTTRNDHYGLSQAFQQLGVIGADESLLSCVAMRCPNLSQSKPLGGLGQPEGVTRKGFGNPPIGADLFEGIACRYRCDASAMGFHSLQALHQGVFGHKRSHPVVNQDRIIILPVTRLKAVIYAFLAVPAAGDNADRPRHLRLVENLPSAMLLIGRSNDNDDFLKKAAFFKYI